MSKSVEVLGQRSVLVVGCPVRTKDFKRDSVIAELTRNAAVGKSKIDVAKGKRTQLISKRADTSWAALSRGLVLGARQRDPLVSTQSKLPSVRVLMQVRESRRGRHGQGVLRARESVVAASGDSLKHASPVSSQDPGILLLSTPSRSCLGWLTHKSAWGFPPFAPCRVFSTPTCAADSSPGVRREEALHTGGWSCYWKRGRPGGFSVKERLCEYSWRVPTSGYYTTGGVQASNPETGVQLRSPRSGTRRDSERGGGQNEREMERKRVCGEKGVGRAWRRKR